MATYTLANNNNNEPITEYEIDRQCHYGRRLCDISNEYRTAFKVNEGISHLIEDKKYLLLLNSDGRKLEISFGNGDTYAFLLSAKAQRYFMQAIGNIMQERMASCKTAWNKTVNELIQPTNNK